MRTIEEQIKPWGYISPFATETLRDRAKCDLTITKKATHNITMPLYTAEHILEAERRAEQRVRAEIARDIKKACETVMGIETPMMRGDNLAVTLCSYFEDMEGEPDDNGWHPKAIEGHDQVKRGIEQHFLKAIDAAREVG